MAAAYKTRGINCFRQVFDHITLCSVASRPGCKSGVCFLHQRFLSPTHKGPAYWQITYL